MSNLPEIRDRLGMNQDDRPLYLKVKTADTAPVNQQPEEEVPLAHTNPLFRK